jgi:hypothetical protein
MRNDEPIAARREGWLLIGWAVLLFTFTVALHLRHNDFPFYYHPDEPGKVEQVQSGKWNFHHPMLLLATVKAVTLKTGAHGEQAIVETGRFVSALFTGVAVVALSLLAYGWRGWPSALSAGAALAFHHQLYELSHYFKEDPALLAGVSLTALMAVACWWRLSYWRIALLGVACALAISGKYIGVMSIAIAAPILWDRREGRTLRFSVFVAALVAAFLAVNLPLLLQLSSFSESFTREVGLVVRGQGGLTRSVPHAQYWNVFVDNTTPVIWLLLGIFLAARWRERRMVPLAHWVIIAVPFVYAIALSFSPKSNDRYFLPATALLTLLAALGIADAARLFQKRMHRRWVTFGAAVALVLGQWPSWIRYEHAFQRDDNAELIAWIKDKLPPTAVLAKDSRIQLPDPEKKKHASRLGVIPQRVVHRLPGKKPVRYAADLAPVHGTVEELAASGITHVAISESDYGRFFLSGLRPQPNERADFERRKAFYESLLRHGDLTFDRERGTVIYLHPGIRVYRIGTPPPVSDESAAFQ